MFTFKVVEMKLENGMFVAAVKGVDDECVIDQFKRGSIRVGSTWACFHSRHSDLIQQLFWGHKCRVSAESKDELIDKIESLYSACKLLSRAEREAELEEQKKKDFEAISRSKKLRELEELKGLFDL